MSVMTQIRIPMDDQAAPIGRVIAVSAAQLIVLLQPPPMPGGPTAREPLEMAALVKIRTRGSLVFGMISGLRVPLPSVASPADDLKIVEIELIGETSYGPSGKTEGFRRGVSIFPALEDQVYLATPDDLAQVYAPPREAAIPVGSIHQNADIPAFLLVNDLLGKHFSIVGTTGSGKSCAVATILRSVIEKNPHAHVILLDPHCEYARAFPEEAIVLSPGDGLHLPYWLFNFDELAEVVFGSNHRAEQWKILSEAVLSAKLAYLGKTLSDRHCSVDTPMPYRVSDLVRYLDNAMGALNRPESVAAYQLVKARMLALQNDVRFGFMFGTSLTLRDEMSDILAQIFRIPVSGKPITILDLSGVPSEVLNVVVSVVCRLTFDFSVWSEKQMPITIVCEEAHRYAPRDKDAGFEPVKRALSRIAKEGRKYGVSLCVVSQRPSDLAPSLLSECNTLFALRMTSQEDQDIVRGALPEASHGLMKFLPALRNGEAIVVGEGVSMPMRICFSPLPENCRPRSETASFTTAWSHDVDDRSEVEQTVERWRRGVRHAA
jgi:DNA helicase HerA-like ATPase